MNRRQFTTRCLGLLAGLPVVGKLLAGKPDIGLRLHWIAYPTQRQRQLGECGRVLRIEPARVIPMEGVREFDPMAPKMKVTLGRIRWKTKWFAGNLNAIGGIKA